MAAKTLEDALREAHLSYVYARAGRAVAVAGDEPTVAAHTAAVNAAADRLETLGAMVSAPPDLAAVATEEVTAMTDGITDVITKYTLIRDDPATGLLLYRGTEGFSDAALIVAYNTALRDAITAELAAHDGAGWPVAGLPRVPVED